MMYMGITKAAQIIMHIFCPDQDDTVTYSSNLFVATATKILVKQYKTYRYPGSTGLYIFHNALTKSCTTEAMASAILVTDGMYNIHNINI